MAIEQALDGSKVAVTGDARFIHSLSVRNLLSFGAETQLELLPLNVLIGPNASGKSNLIEAIWADKWPHNGALVDFGLPSQAHSDHLPHQPG